jgi:hypothetical protein
MESERQKGSIQVTALGYFFLSYGYSAMIGGVPLFYFKKKEDSNYGKEKNQNK